MCVCVCVYVCMYVRTCIHTYMRIYVYNNSCISIYDIKNIFQSSLSYSMEKCSVIVPITFNHNTIKIAKWATSKYQTLTKKVKKALKV